MTGGDEIAGPAGDFAGGGTYMGEAAWMGMGARSMKGVAVVVRRMEDMVADGG